MERYAWLKRPGSCLLLCEEAVDEDSQWRSMICREEA